MRGSTVSQEGRESDDQIRVPVPPKAVRLCAYGAPTVPGASEVVPIDGAGFTVIPQPTDAACPRESGKLQRERRGPCNRCSREGSRGVQPQPGR